MRGREDLAQPTPGRQLRPFFTVACIEAREAAGASYARVADLIGLDGNTVRRFESGKIWPGETIEAYMAGYAEINGGDGRAILARALELWQQHGKRPLSSHERAEKREMPPPSRQSYVQDVMTAIRRAEERAQAARPPTAIRTKRAAGE